MQFPNLAKLLLRFRFIPERLIKASELVMGVGLPGIEGYGTEQRWLSILVLLLLHVEGAQIHIDNAQIAVYLQRLLEQG